VRRPRASSFRSHWRFASDFCNSREPHEKGGVEGEAGYFWRNHWVPLPHARDLHDLNAQLLAACHEDEKRVIAPTSAVTNAASRCSISNIISMCSNASPVLDRLEAAGRVAPTETVAGEL
jgi:hypothetical protein